MLLEAGTPLDLRSLPGLGRAVLLAGAGGSAVGGLIIGAVGVTDVFVPEDLEFMSISVHELDRVSPRLVPLMAHDRAGFGGAVFIAGLTTLFCLWCSRPSRHLWEAVAIAGGVSLGAALGVHGLVRYTDPWHLAPAVTAAGSLVLGLAMTMPRASGRDVAVQLHSTGLPGPPAMERSCWDARPVDEKCWQRWQIGARDAQIAVSSCISNQSFQGSHRWTGTGFDGEVVCSLGERGLGRKSGCSASKTGCESCSRTHPERLQQRSETSATPAADLRQAQLEATDTAQQDTLS